MHFPERLFKGIIFTLDKLMNNELLCLRNFCMQPQESAIKKGLLPQWSNIKNKEIVAQVCAVLVSNKNIP